MTRRLLAVTAAVALGGLTATPAIAVPRHAVPTGAVSAASSAATAGGADSARPPLDDDRPWPPDRGKAQGPPWDICRIIPYFCR